MTCPEWPEPRRRMLAGAKTDDYRTLVGSAKGLRAASRMIMETGLLGQFELAKILLYGEV